VYDLVGKIGKELTSDEAVKVVIEEASKMMVSGGNKQ